MFHFLHLRLSLVEWFDPNETRWHRSFSPILCDFTGIIGNSRCRSEGRRFGCWNCWNEIDEELEFVLETEANVRDYSNEYNVVFGTTNTLLVHLIRLFWVLWSCWNKHLRRSPQNSSTSFQTQSPPLNYAPNWLNHSSWIESWWVN